MMTALHCCSRRSPTRTISARGKLIGNLDNDLYEMIGELYAKRGDTARAEEAFRLAARGNFDLTGAIYYNDQPPQMMYYAAKALAALGETDEAQNALPPLSTMPKRTAMM